MKRQKIPLQMITMDIMSTERYFWIFNINKIIDMYNTISSSEMLDKQVIITNLKGKKNDYLIITYLHLLNKFKIIAASLFDEEIIDIGGVY